MRAEDTISALGLVKKRVLSAEYSSYVLSFSLSALNKIRYGDALLSSPKNSCICN